MVDTSPYSASRTAPVPAVAQAVTTAVAVAVAPLAGTVSRVYYAPNAAITGANTHTRLVELINSGTDGLGATVVASLQFDLGVDAVALNETIVTLGAAADLVVGQNDVLVWKSTSVGNGLADPGGLLRIEIERS